MKVNGHRVTVKVHKGQDQVSCSNKGRWAHINVKLGHYIEKIYFPFQQKNKNSAKTVARGREEMVISASPQEDLLDFLDRSRTTSTCSQISELSEASEMSIGTEEEDQPIMIRTPSVDDVEMESPEISTSPKSPDMSISPKWQKNKARVRFVSESSDTESLCNSAAASATMTDVSSNHVHPSN